MHRDEDILLSTVSDLLRHVRNARPGSLDQLFDHVYPDLKRLAGRILDRRARGHRSVSATTLVNGACVRLLKADALRAEDRRHFFRLFCRAMENEWIDRARHDLALKRGGKRVRESLDDVILEPSPASSAFLDLRDSLAEFARVDPEAAEVVHLRYYCNATLKDTAQIMGCSLATVRSNWDYAKSWLLERLTRGTPESDRPNV